MDDGQRAFLDSLLSTPSPAGYEVAGQRVWIEHVSRFADEITTDAYGNAVAVHEGSNDGPAIAVAGHADEIGFVVRRIDDDGFLRIGAIGGIDRTVTRGQHVTIHADDPVAGVVGQAAVHLRDADEDSVPDLGEQFVDVGATSREEAADLVEVGDPVTFSATVEDLHGTRLAARGMDNRVGTWAAAEGLRRAIEADVDATVYAISTVQEELGSNGAQMVGFDLDLDAAIAVDVTNATDSPAVSEKRRGPVELGAGPVITRGSANHPKLVDLARRAAAESNVDVQLQAAGTYTGTDADAFFTSRGGLPTLNIGVPNRYMHTPVEVVDADDLDALAELLGAIAARAADAGTFAVEL